MLSFFLFLLKHKWYVFLAGCLYTKTPLNQLIIHDWSKFTPVEFNCYRKKHQKLPFDQLDMETAWLNHQNHNHHHWEYWLSRTGHGNEGVSIRETPIEMPEKYIREMVADWLAASRTYGKEKDWAQVGYNWDWLKEHGVKKMRGRLHPNTIKGLDKVFKEIHYKQTLSEESDLFTKYLKNY